MCYTRMTLQSKNKQIVTEKTTTWLSFELENDYHELLVKISSADDRSMAKEVKSLIKTRAKQLGFVKESKK